MQAASPALLSIGDTLEDLLKDLDKKIPSSQLSLQLKQL